jgi:cytochrome c-type biogenesis protein CcmF
MVYILLIVFLMSFLLFGVILLIIRIKDIQKTKIEYHLLTREVALSLGSLVLAISGLIILVGTSYPIFAKSNVDTSFYNNWNLPLAILITFLNGYSLLMKWKENDKREVFKKSLLGLVLSAVSTAVTVFIGVRDIAMILLVWSSFFALYVNVERFYNIILAAPIKVGASVAHIGVSLLFLGIVGSARYSETKNVQLPLNKAVSAFDYNLTYLGEEPFDSGKKSYFNVKVEKGGESVILKPIMFFNPMGNGLMKIPDIKVTATKDLYFSPVGVEAPKNNEQILEIGKGETQNIDNHKVTFLEYKMGEHGMDQMRMGGEFSISAKVKVEYPDNSSEVLELTTKYNQKVPDLIPVRTKDSKAEFALAKIFVSQGAGAKAQILYNNLSLMNSKPQEEILIAEVSIKPFILLFWGGSIIMTLGFFISIIRRWKELYGH